MTSGIRKPVLAWRFDEGLIACRGADREGQLPDEVERDQVDVPLRIGGVNDLLMAIVRVSDYPHACAEPGPAIVGRAIYPGELE